MRVAIVDYFINHTEMMKEPIVVELRVFKENEKLALVDSLTGLFNKRFYDLPDDDELVISGKVVWVKRINEELLSYGVKFNDIDTKDANKLKEILPEKFQNFSYEYYL